MRRGRARLRSAGGTGYQTVTYLLSQPLGAVDKSFVVLEISFELERVLLSFVQSCFQSQIARAVFDVVHCDRYSTKYTLSETQRLESIVEKRLKC